MVYLVSVYFVIHSLRIVTAPQSYYKLYVLNTSSLINNKFTDKHVLLIGILLHSKVRVMTTIKSISMIMTTLISVLGDTLIKMMLPYNEKPLFVSPMNECRFHLLLYLQVIDVSEWQEADEYQTH